MFAEAEYMLVGPVARICGVADQTVRNWHRQGKLPGVVTSSGVRLFRRGDVERVARARGVAGVGAPATPHRTAALEAAHVNGAHNTTTPRP